MYLLKYMILTLYTMNLCLLIAVSKSLSSFREWRAVWILVTLASMKQDCSHHLSNALESSE